MSDFMQGLGEMALMGKDLSLEKSVTVIELLYYVRNREILSDLDDLSHTSCLP